MNEILTGKRIIQNSEEIQEEQKIVPVEQGAEIQAEESKDIHPDDLCFKGTYKLKLSPDDEHELEISQFFEDFDDTNDVRNLDMALKFVTEEIDSL